MVVSLCLATCWVAKHFNSGTRQQCSRKHRERSRLDFVRCAKWVFQTKASYHWQAGPRYISHTGQHFAHPYTREVSISSKDAKPAVILISLSNGKYCLRIDPARNDAAMQVKGVRDRERPSRESQMDPQLVKSKRMRVLQMKRDDSGEVTPASSSFIAGLDISCGK